MGFRKHFCSLALQYCVSHAIFSYCFEIYEQRMYTAVIKIHCNHGRRKGGSWPHWILKFSANKGYFLVLSEKKQISPHLSPLENFGKIP